MSLQRGEPPDVIIIPFDVDDNELRVAFFDHFLMDAMSALLPTMPPHWGSMTAQHMAEHLLWAFRCSTGELVLPCCTPESLLERVRRFLYDNRPTPHEFKNPVLGPTPPPLYFKNLGEAMTALDHEVIRFTGHLLEEPRAFNVHPIFGPLDAEDWQRAHFKHCYHHLLQFGLIRGPGPELL
jgi:hypothetical protein